MPSSAQTQSRRWFWERFSPDDPHAGADLAALRRGLGRSPGDVPEMWSYYTTLNRHGDIRPELVAEHAALSLFGVHQQSQPRRMHRPDVGVGDAGLELRRSDGYSSEAVDRRMNAIATATSPTELIGHLKGLVALLRQSAQPVDYTRLCDDIRRWHYTEARVRIRGRWGGQYFDWSRRDQSPARTPA